MARESAMEVEYQGISQLIDAKPVTARARMKNLSMKEKDMQDEMVQPQDKLLSISEVDESQIE